MDTGSLTDALRETLAVFGGSGTPRTTTEVADRLDLGRRSTYERLDRLVDHGELRTKKVGANARVWWRPRAGSTADTTAPGDADGIPREDLERFRSLVDSIEGYAIALLDPDGRVRTWNDGARGIAGYDREEIVGEHFSVFYAADDRAAGVPEGTLTRASEAGDLEDERWWVRADDSRFWAKVTVTALYDERDELRGFAAIVHDLTDRRERERQLRRERDLIERVFETVPVGIGVLSPAGDVVRTNEKARELLGVTEGKAGAYAAGERRIYDADGDPVPPDERPYGKVLETGEPVFDWQCQIERPDGERRWLSVNAAPMAGEDDELDRVVTATEDVTRLKEQARRLELQRDDLRVELDEVFARIDDAFFALDDEWRFTYVNDTAADIVGLSADELLGARVFDAIPEVAEGRPRRQAERAMTTQESTEFDFHSEMLDRWIDVQLYPSDTGLSVYFRDVTERKEREHELELYETIVETMDDGVYVLDEEFCFTEVNDAYAEMTGYDRDHLLGSHCTLVVDENVTAESAVRTREIASGDATGATIEADIHRADGSRLRAESRFTALESDDATRPRKIGVVRDVSERVERERELQSQRERLAALDDLNRVVRNLSEAVIDQSTREEIERTVCEGLATSDSYLFAWIGDVDAHSQAITLRTEAGVEGYLEDTAISVDPDDPRGAGPTGRAIQTHEMQVAEDVLEEEAYEPWHDRARELGFRSSAAVPLVHGEVLFGVLNVYADRRHAFTGDEREVIGHLGEVIGHAIAAVERKRALTSDEVVELEFRMSDVAGALDLQTAVEGRFTLDRAVPVGDGAYLEYGTATDDALDALDALVDALPAWESVRRLGETNGGDTRFELRLVDPPVLSAVTDLGGYVERAVIEDGDYFMQIQLAPSTDARHVINVVREAYPSARLVTRQQVTRDADEPAPYSGALTDEFTERQRAALEAAYFAGYFKWPRDTSGEEVAESLGVSAPTFHQHLRKAQRKVLDVVLDDAAPA